MDGRIRRVRMQTRPTITTATRQPRAPLHTHRSTPSSQPPRKYATATSRRQLTSTAHCSSMCSKQRSARTLTEVLHSNTLSSPHTAHSVSNSQCTCSARDPHLVLTIASSSSISSNSNSSTSDPHPRHSAMSQINTLRRIFRQIDNPRSRHLALDGDSTETHAAYAGRLHCYATHTFGWVSVRSTRRSGQVGERKPVGVLYLDLLTLRSFRWAQERGAKKTD
jgi:hypothetical protein